MPRVLFLLIFFSAAALVGRPAPAQPPAAGPAWKVAVKWHEPLTDAERATIRAGVRKYADEVTNLPAAKDATVERGAVRALALMNALPYLRPDADERKKLDKDGLAALRAKFDAARAHAAANMDAVLELYLPEYQAALLKVKKDGVKKGENSPLDQVRADFTPVMKFWTAASAKAHGDWAYSLPVVLLAVEYAIANGLEQQFDPGFDDRPPLPTFRPPLVAQAGLVRLLCLLMWSGNGDKLDAPMVPGICWSYRFFAHVGEDSAGCASKSGTALMGIRSLAGGLGLFQFDAAAFDIKFAASDKEPLGRAAVMNRLSDVLVHGVWSMAVDFKMPKEATVGFGTDNWKKLHTDGKAAYDHLVKHAPPDVSRYRVVTAADPNGRPLLRVDHAADADGLDGDERVAFWRYRSNAAYARYAAYHSASGAFVTVACANTLIQLLDAEKHRATVGTRYPLAAAGAGRRLDFGGKKYAVRTDGPGRFTRLVIAADADLPTAGLADRQPIDTRVAQGLNHVAWLLSKPKDAARPDGERKLNKGDDDKGTNWEELLPLGGHPQFIGIDAYAVLKLALVADCDPYIGAWNYYRDLGLALCAWTPPSESAEARAFVILFLTKGLRPAFPVDSPTK